MQFAVSEEIFEKYPGAVIGVVVARRVDNTGESAAVMQLLRSAEADTRKQLVIEQLAENPLIQNWRNAYKAFGERKDRASHEALIRRVLKGDSLRHINTLVDIYNALSLKYRVPMGGENLDGIEGGIALTVADGTERFIMLGSLGSLGLSEATHPEKGEVVYKDGNKILCRKWNWRESDETKLTEATKNAVIVIDALPPASERGVAAVAQELAGLVEEHCSAQTAVYVLTAARRSALISS